jgi:hypothetical protein
MPHRKRDDHGRKHQPRQARPARATAARERRRSHHGNGAEAAHRSPLSPRDHYWREKMKRVQQRPAAADPLEEARRAFEKMLAAEAEAQRGGRPRGSRTRGGARHPGASE